MNTASALTHCRLTPPCKFALSRTSKFSLRRLNKHLECIPPNCTFSDQKSPDYASFTLKCTASKAPSNLDRKPSLHQLSLLPTRSKNRSFRPVKCSYSDSTISESRPSLFDNFKNLSSESLKETLLKLTPFDVCKLSLVLSVAIVGVKWAASVLFSPFFWMYFSWTWLFWPWMVAVAVGVYGIFCFRKHLKGEANEFEQLSIVTSAFTWLTLVPPAYFNGFLEGWPYVFFFVYHYFFFFNVSVRKRMYGDFNPREHDPKWDVSTPTWQRLLFSVGVVAGHWFAALEGPELHLIPGGWSNVGVWALIMTTLFMQYHSTLYLAKYSEKVVVPTAVVQFGPYRWVRHPIYASTMLLMATYFLALRAPVSSLFTIAICLLYYGQKAKVEETLMTDTFGKSYTEYMDRVKYKLIPFVY
ncbi:hypothetical protein DCAR_0206690 [Daucus carota subsp. sativus]|uniref:Protein-S-isoprenylcysteine O-methyltransferase n=1 Tax=Daucus carota subsp. sativus TaxID=79200 RepID=A0A166DD54_DAUCS|nr:PREDICTED: uncharacterized protein LOC108206202 [Daucus carota subsp. sativus]WOG87465.1 hypothetical protein DCAR_0206690 [Daucus carota subsp. sativus]